MLFYSVADLVIASEIALPGRTSVAQVAEAAVTIRLGQVPPSLSRPVIIGPNWALNQGELVLSMPGLASFLLVGGGEIRIQPASGRGREDAAPFLTQNLLGLLMQQRGRLVMRASSVAIHGRAVLFCGVAAAGKSAVAAAMAARGHAVLGDDFCVVDWAADGTALVHGDGADLMLWTDSIDALDLAGKVGAALREGCRKYHVRPRARSPAGLPLEAIYLLGEDRRIETSRIAALRGIRAVRAIRESRYRSQALTAEQQRGSFEAAASIARRTPIFSLARARGFDWIDEGLDAIETGFNGTTEAKAPQ